VDAPLPAPDALVRPWKTATIVASFVAAVELVLLLVAALFLLAKPLSHAMAHHAQAAALAPEKTTKARPAAGHSRRKISRHVVPTAKLPRRRTGVIVLNGNGRTGAAAAGASRLQHLGYRVKSTGNARRQDYATTVVMYRRGYEGEGVRLAHDLHVKVVGPLDGLSPSALHGGQLAVVLGAS
jgi:hypothetical protein